MLTLVRSPLRAGAPRERYARAYARLRASEGRGSAGEAELLALPYLASGPMREQWRIRVRTYEAFLAHVLGPAARDAGGAASRAVRPDSRDARPLDVLDLGAGNGWLCYRLAALGHRGVAVDIRLDDVDGLGAAAPYARHLPLLFPRVAASFDALPLRPGTFDVALFNASLHYAADLSRVLFEARRALRPGGRLAILDSPFYVRAETGEAMVEEKRRQTRERWPELADDLLALPAIEFLTRAALEAAARPLGLRFRRRHVRYPWAYEKRAFVAARKGLRAPSRFDLWTAVVP